MCGRLGLLLRQPRCHFVFPVAVPVSRLLGLYPQRSALVPVACGGFVMVAPFSSETSVGAMMKKSDRNEVGLQIKAESWKNRDKLRQRLADLLGMLIARHWLRNELSRSATHHGTEPITEGSESTGNL